MNHVLKMKKTHIFMYIADKSILHNNIVLFSVVKSRLRTSGKSGTKLSTCYISCIGNNNLKTSWKYNFVTPEMLK